MEQAISKTTIVNQLQQSILQWQGFAPPTINASKRIGLGDLETAFPNGVFPTGSIHEMLCSTREHTAATTGLLCGILAALMKNGGVCLWISTNRRLFPPAMDHFSAAPEKFIFIDVEREKDVLWVMEEALKCDGLAAVIAEIRQITFAQSRRLQLAVESSKVTGFLLRTDLKKLTTNVCVARWQVSSLPSVLEDDMPGVGYPCWEVELLRVRNGLSGKWQLQWNGNGFAPAGEDVSEHHPTTQQHQNKATAVEYDLFETRQAG